MYYVETLNDLSMVMNEMFSKIGTDIKQCEIMLQYILAEMKENNKLLKAYIASKANAEPAHKSPDEESEKQEKAEEAKPDAEEGDELEATKGEPVSETEEKAEEGES